MEYGLIVTVMCLAIVFGVLAFLIAALYALQYITRGGKNKKPAKVMEELPEPSVGAVVNEDEEIIAAVISAAIQMMLAEQSEDKKAKFLVRSIKRI